MQYTWHQKKLAEGKATQVYGFVITADNLIALVRDKGEERYTPVGGGVEDGESAQEAFVRELEEEAQLKPQKLELLGTLEIVDELQAERHLQVRYACWPESINDFIPCKGGFEVEERVFVHIDELPRYIHWINTPDGQLLYRTLRQVAKA